MLSQNLEVEETVEEDEGEELERNGGTCEGEDWGDDGHECRY